jgi:hypothetical protein
MAHSRHRDTDLLRSPLRAAYERVRALPLVQQMRECIDLLENPAVLASDLAETYVLLDAECDPPADPPDGEAAGAAPDGEEEEELTLEHFHPGREVRIVGDDGSDQGAFVCLAGAFHPLAPRALPPPDGGVDYLGLVREPAFPSTGPVLGAVESLGDATPYAVLLRLLACLTEVAPAPQREWLDRRLFKGALGTSPVFDLHVVLWQPPGDGEGPPAQEHGSLFELTRDLAEVVKGVCFETPQLAAMLGQVVCLRMDPEDLHGPLTLEWQL